ncbi:hypothetical protein [Helicobacter trogontum]|nr:hypothetical protein [Helicobacter trogontum]
MNIEEIVEKIKRKQDEMGNRTPSLNNIYDALLEEFPKIKSRSKESREVIVKHLKNSTDQLSKGIEIQLKDLIYRILGDIADIFKQHTNHLPNLK